MWVLGLNLGLLEEQPVLLAAEPSLQPLSSVLLMDLKYLASYHKRPGLWRETDVGDPEMHRG